MGVTFCDGVEEFIYDPDIQNCPPNGFIHDLMSQKLDGTYLMIKKEWAVSLTGFFGILFIGISLILRSANVQVRKMVFRYDNETGSSIDFTLYSNIPQPVYFYYELRNLSRNNRGFNNGYCRKQLYYDGNHNSDCDERDVSYKNNHYLCENPNPNTIWLFFTSYCANRTFYAPIGSVGATMFNDTFTLVREIEKIDWTDEGVVDDKIRQMYAAPDNNTNMCDSPMFKDTIKPPYWRHHICKVGGYQNVTFIKWMEKVAYSDFKKHYKTLDTKYEDGLPPGNYTLYFTNDYKGGNRTLQKYFWILHPSWVGTEQIFLENLYLAVGTGLLALTCLAIYFQIFLIDRRKVYNENDCVGIN